jgi:2-polyprenyl-3-methyl-5-hydroxy-6-metoxy-1,4-benzoquinol methylase
VHSLRAAFRAWRSYRGCGVRLQAFLAARLIVLPMGPLAAEFRRLDGRVLGVGSGHGLLARWLAELNPGVSVDGVDLDPDRVAIAAATEQRSPRVRLRVQDVRALDEREAFDAVAAVDLIHHVPLADHAALLEALARALKPGGTLLIKDVARTPRWKHAVNSLHDRLVAGESTTFTRDPEDLAESVEQAGFTVERCYRTGALNPYPHFILRARRTRPPAA